VSDWQRPVLDQQSEGIVGRDSARWTVLGWAEAAGDEQNYAC
jgi:hypothetical protein